MHIQVSQSGNGEVLILSPSLGNEIYLERGTSIVAHYCVGEKIEWKHLGKFWLIEEAPKAHMRNLRKREELLISTTNNVPEEGEVV